MTTRIGTLLGSILLLMAAMASAQTVQRVTSQYRSRLLPEATICLPAITLSNSTVRRTR
jgi:hypothetical protein